MALERIDAFYVFFMCSIRINPLGYMNSDLIGSGGFNSTFVRVVKNSKSAIDIETRKQRLTLFHKHHRPR